MDSLFIYGTLRDPALLRVVLGKPPEQGSILKAELPGHETLSVKDDDFPMIREAAGALAPGLLLAGLGPGDLRRLDFFEGAYGYSRKPCQVSAGGKMVSSQAYFPHVPLVSDGKWDFGKWLAKDRGLAAGAASEAMELMGTPAAGELVERYPMIEKRAQARISAAREERRAALGEGFTVEDVDSHALARPYSRHFSVEEHSLRHRLFSGERSRRITRAVFMMGDAVSVIPYDPKCDKLLLVEQFRAGAFARGDKIPWLIEPVAGQIEPGESPEEAARREAREEAGIEIGELRQIAAYYSSPGAVSEFLVSYVGIADLSAAQSGTYGLESDGENIRTVILPGAGIQELLDSGEARNGPLALSLLWLLANRERLAGAGASPA